MTYTQNRKIAQVKETSLVAGGVDVGGQYHYARAFDWRGIEASACWRSLLDMRDLLLQKVGENKGYNARRVH